MERKMTQQLTIVPGLCDSTARLGVPDAFRLFMDIAGEHAETIGVGAAAMQARRLFWLTVRTMIRFHRRPVLAEHAALATFPGIPGKARCMRYYTLTQGEALIMPPLLTRAGASMRIEDNATATAAKTT